jgi:hypothetical protein
MPSLIGFDITLHMLRFILDINLTRLRDTQITGKVLSLDTSLNVFPEESGV